MWHRWGLEGIISCIFHGILQQILIWAPLVSPGREPDWPPDWFLFFYSYSDWGPHRDRDGIPDGWLINRYISGAFRTLGYWIEECRDWALNTAKDAVRAWIGYVKDGFGNFSDWVHAVYTRVGTGMVWWSTNVINALDRIYGWIPEPIRTQIRSWADYIESFIALARQWVTSTYAALIAVGILAWNWVTGTGNAIRAWWEQARGVLDEFRANPVGFIVSRLGWSWLRLVWFSDNLLDWVSGLRSGFGTTLVEFLQDPAGWMWDRLCAQLERLW